tara:strand:- start:15239 stop:15904 length:666 start_codon:yes stop_codon:yes gene_type:complete
MGYLDNSTITVDAILTKKGRELLARGQNEFQITQFALADDEVDYDLYNPEHPLGTAFYGAAIENMPVTEALTDESQMMKYKLVTLPKGTARIPVISIGQTELELGDGQQAVIRPATTNFAQGNTSFGYTAILSDSDAAEIVATRSAPNQSGASVPQFIGDNEAAQTVTVTGAEFQITAKGQLTSTRTATILFIGNETGGRATLTITIRPTQLQSIQNIQAS